MCSRKKNYHLVKITCLGLILLNTIIVTSAKRKDLSVGQSCTLDDGRAGTCAHHSKCDYWKKKLQNQEFPVGSDLCGYQGIDPILCCPEERPGASTEKPTAPPINLRPAARACQEYRDFAQGYVDSRAGPSTHIINGEVALPGQLPFMAALGYQNNPENPLDITYICGGSLISERYVLTAAHCALNIHKYTPIEVRLGSVDLRVEDEDTQRIPISDIKLHPRFRSSQNYFDIAIIEMSRPATLKRNSTVPICLQTFPREDSKAVEEKMIVAGWGITDINSETPSDELRYTRNLTFIDKQTCAADYESSVKLPQGVDDSLICVLDIESRNRSDACQGDSGGPLFYDGGFNGILHGIVSFGQSCASSVPGIYTSVVYHLDWIEKIVWPDETCKTYR